MLGEDGRRTTWTRTCFAGDEQTRETKALHELTPLEQIATCPNSVRVAGTRRAFRIFFRDDEAGRASLGLFLAPCVSRAGSCKTTQTRRWLPFKNQDPPVCEHDASRPRYQSISERERFPFLETLSRRSPGGKYDLLPHLHPPFRTPEPARRVAENKKP